MLILIMLGVTHSNATGKTNLIECQFNHYNIYIYTLYITTKLTLARLFAGVGIGLWPDAHPGESVVLTKDSICFL